MHVEDFVIGDRWVVRLASAAVILSTISCGSSNNGSGPGPCDPALATAGGNGQTGEISVQLPDTLKVLATTCDPANPQGPQLPEAGVSILWVVTGGGGTVNSVTSDTVVTDSAGLARAVWVLGSTVGTQTVSATALRSTPDVASFSATATAPATGCPPGSTQHAGGVITSDQTWGAGGHVVNGNISFGSSATLTIAAGAHVCFEGGGLEFREQSHLDVAGSSASPVIIEQGASGASLTFGVNIFGLTTPSTISNARLEGVGISVSGAFHPVVVESTLVRNAGVSLGAPGSEFKLSTIAGGRLIITAQDGGPIVVEATVRGSSAEGIFINGTGVTLIRCELTGNATDGILSAGDATTISVHSSNLFGNGGAGVNNGDLGALDASGNWWGDPAGPSGPSGDGVTGNVTVAGALSAPAILGYRPPE